MIATIDWKVLGIAAILLLVAMVLLYRMMSRDTYVRRTRYGFFIERDRYDEDEYVPDEDTQIIEKHWPKQEER